MKTQIRHLIILISLLFFGLSAHAHIYLDPSGGNDTKNGTTYANRVKSLSKAIALSKTEIGTGNSDKWIILCSTITVDGDSIWNGETNNSSWNIHIMRIWDSDHQFAGSVFTVNTNKKLTLSNITVDGRKFEGSELKYIYGSGNKALIYLNDGAELTINSGTVLRRNRRLRTGNDPRSTTEGSNPALMASDGGAIEGNCAHVTMNNGQIAYCSAARYGGGIYLSSTGATSNETTSSFIMKGGQINNCEAYGNHSGGGVYIKGTFQNGTDESGGLWYAQVTLTKGKIHDNFANVNKAAAYASTTNGKGNGRGAGINCAQAIVYMDGNAMEVYNNKAFKFGGGVQITYGSVFYFSKGKIYNNIAYDLTEDPSTSGATSTISAVQSGGAGIHIAYGYVDIKSELHMSGGEVYGNKALDGYGGGIHTSNLCELNISGGKIYNNEAKWGGGINLQRCRKLEFAENTTVEVYGNTARNGGGISIDGSPLIVKGGSFHDNVADQAGLSNEFGKGGAFYVHTDNENCTEVASVEMSGGSICNNSASYQGGGIFIREPRTSGLTDKRSQVLIQGGLLDGNSAVNRGGGIYVFTGDVTLQGGASIINNTAGDIGGGILFDQSSHLTMGAGDINVKDNMANSKPDNIYLFQKDGANNPKTISIAEDVTFNPRYVGIYTQKRTPNIPVFDGTNDQLTTIYDGMKSGNLHIYDDSQQFSPLNPGSGTTLYFGSSPWSVLQQQTTLDDLHPVGDPAVYEIYNVKDLTAFLCHVNGITLNEDTPEEVSFGPGDQTANGKLMADIDMDGHYWVPISTGYTGTFDGNGYTISHLTMVSTNVSTGRGLFGINTSGTIKNVILKDCYFGSTTASTNLGGIVSSNGGTVNNSVVEGTFYVSLNTCVIGGVAGANSGTIHSCYAAPNMTGYQMGGLVGTNSGNLYNSFANASFDYKGGKYCGGLVGVNTGKVENCYSRVQGTAPSPNFGWLVGSNSGTGLKYCYIPSGKTPFRSGGDIPLAHGYYDATVLPVQYDHSDNQVTLLSSDEPNPYVPTGNNKQLLATLNKWVKENGPSTYTYWLRPWQKDDDSKFINDDLPLLRLPATNAVAATSGDPYLDYNQVNDLLTAYHTADDAVLFYGAESNMNGNIGSEASLYIDQEATLKQSGSKGAITARTSQMLKTYTAERWHHFSSPLKESQIGFTYNNTAPVPFNWNSNPCSVTINSNDDYSLFPSDLLTATSFASVDLFCFYEPEYHWLNLKRATNSHWHMNDTDLPISYEGNGIQPDPANPGGDPSIGNETYLVPGKGYLVSVDVDQLVQNYGTLNNGNVTLYSVTKSDYNAWAERLGFNLLGNPYQSYLDFEEFKDENGSNLWASDADIYEYTYAVFDPQLNAYRQYKDGSSVFSNAASQYIHPHQGFFIRMTKGTDPANRTTVTYTDDMRVVTLPENVTSPYRGATQPAFPLINLVVRDSEGNGDVAVLELGRNNNEGTEKIRLSECKGLLSLGYEGHDYGILFRTEIEDYQPLRFEALEGGTFTLEWNTANGQFSELTLIDNIAGTTTDMLSRDSYSFEGNPGQYASRFKIVIGDYKDIEDHEEDGPSTGSGTFAFVMDDELVVNGEGALSLYDVTGRLLMQTSLHGSQTNIALPEVSAGVYVLQLVSDHNGKKTQKIILE